MDVASGSPPGVAVGGWRGLHFSRKDAITRHLGLWSPDGLLKLIARIQETVLATRRSADLADPLTERLVLDIARAAAARGRR